MQIKVCGMKYPENISELIHLPIDMMGLIFYEKSARYAGGLPADALRIVPPGIQKVGVFVNSFAEEIFEKARKYDLQMVQLHGVESPDFCKKLKNAGIKVIKAFQIEKAGDLQRGNWYENTCDYFLFDTKTPAYGGSGQKFDWEILSSYTGQTPFILSGGIGPEDAESIRKIRNPKLYGVDLNSRFEVRPGEKDIEKLRGFLSLTHLTNLSVTI
ncbi:N-(5'-phosphoribosyl)anthranilate isomerase [Bacteroidia bacterium]|nr:N-(5'-phosphoribosyl)anthranilate isomerase [Bacteroidia bacterium]